MTIAAAPSSGEQFTWSGLPAIAASQKFSKWASDVFVDLADFDPLALDLAVVRDLRPLGDEIVAVELLAVAEHERAVVAADDLRDRRFLRSTSWR